MARLRIINLMKQVPVSSQMRMGEDGLMDRTAAKSMINDDCSYALEQSLELKAIVPDAELIVVSMGPPAFEQSMRKAISLGFDRGVLLSDRRLGGSDTFSTGLAIATLLKKIGIKKGSGDPFIIFAGRQTSDGDTAHVPSQVAENLGIPQVTFVESIEYAKDHLLCRRIIEGGFQVLKVPIPCLVAIAPTATPLRRPTLKGGVKSRKVNIESWNLEQIGLSPEQVGLIGSPTMVSKVVDIQRERPPAVMIAGPEAAVMTQDLMTAIQAEGLERDVGSILQEDDLGVPVPPVSVERPSDYPRVDFRQGAKGIMTWVEMHDTVPARSSLEILNPARKLADQLGTRVTAVVVGSNIRGVAKEIIAYGADEVIVVEDPRLSEYTVLPLTSIFSQLIKEARPEIMLLGATTSGRELAPRIASRVRAGVTADCTDLRIGEFVHRIKKTVFYPCLESVRPTYGESKLATIVGFWCPQMSTARPGTFELPPRDPSRMGKLRMFTPELKAEDFDVGMIKTVREKGGAQNLFAADIIVAGGRICGELDNFRLIQELVAALKSQGINADWGGTRQAVDHGYVPYARQIGQTGKTVRPKVYVAVAVSGAIQHIVGMKESGTIIAVNQDPSANVFRYADYGVVCDYREILPLLIAEIQEGFTLGFKPAALV